MGIDETEARRVDGDIDEQADVEGQGRKFFRDPEERAAKAGEKDGEQADVEGHRRHFVEPAERAARAGDKDDEGQARR